MGNYGLVPLSGDGTQAGGLCSVPKLATNYLEVHWKLACPDSAPGGRDPVSVLAIPVYRDGPHSGSSRVHNAALEHLSGASSTWPVTSRVGPHRLAGHARRIIHGWQKPAQA